MVLMILEILSLEDLISPMATTICSSEWLVSTNLCCDEPTRSAAEREFSVFLRAMELISSLDAEVSSREAACSEAPCASDWLDDDTCEAALAVCSAPSLSSVTVCRKAPLIWRTMKTTPTATTSDRAIISTVIQRLSETEASASLATAAVSPSCCCFKRWQISLTLSRAGIAFSFSTAAASLTWSLAAYW